MLPAEMLLAAFTALRGFKRREMTGFDVGVWWTKTRSSNVFSRKHMGVFLNGGTPKSSIFNRVFHYKPSILRYPYFWKPPYRKVACFFPKTTGRSCWFCGEVMMEINCELFSRKWFLCITMGILYTSDIGYKLAGFLTGSWYNDCNMDCTKEYRIKPAFGYWGIAIEATHRGEQFLEREWSTQATTSGA